MPEEKKELISRLFSSIGDEINMGDERFLVCVCVCVCVCIINMYVI